MKKQNSWMRRLAAMLLIVCMLPVINPVKAARVDAQLTSSAAGMSHSLAIDAEGNVYVWGSNTSNQLGLGSGVTECKEPTKLDFILATSVAAGYDFSAALIGNGSVYAWGYGTYETPTLVSNLSNVVAIAAGQACILAVKADGTVWQWNLSDGSLKQISALEHIVSVSAGTSHYLALGRDGAVYAWGSNTHGELGNGTTEDSAQPVQVAGLSNVISIAAGTSHSLAVGFNGLVYAWGDNSFGQLGDQTTEERHTPVEVKKLTGVVCVTAGYDSSMALDKSGKVYTWGYGEYGQLGLGSSKTEVNVPTAVSELSKVREITFGVYHSAAVTQDGRLYAWGRNKLYQVGDGKNDNVSKPKVIMKELAKTGSQSSTSIILDGIDTWARTDAVSLEARGIVAPSSWDGYKSDISRAEFVAMLVHVYESVKGSVAPSSTTEFKDLDGHILEQELRKSIKLGLLSGTSSTTLSPDAPLNREMAAKILYSFLSKIRVNSGSANNSDVSFFPDGVEISLWAAPFVNYVYQNKIMMGNNVGAFMPQKNLTTQECIVVIARLAEQYNWTAA